ncbi:unnamed protein product [Leptosia nina]|uniref:Uncharacterized protein n=1 Tax=Leptosia nina TaxID=320188 RepID=A0AAV1ITA4_9NEOP
MYHCLLLLFFCSVVNSHWPHHHDGTHNHPPGFFDAWGHGPHGQHEHWHSSEENSSGSSEGDSSDSSGSDSSESCEEDHNTFNKANKNTIDFESLARKIIDTDEAYYNSCNQNKNNVQEIYSIDSYMLIYSVPGVISANVNVQIRHRVINVVASSTGNNFKDVRMLSDILNPAEARWYTESGTIKVLIPYKIRFDQLMTTRCEMVKKDLINVQPLPDVSTFERHDRQGGISNFSPKPRRTY